MLQASEIEKKYFKIHSIYVLREKHHNKPKNHEQKNYYIVENFLNLIIIHINPSIIYVRKLAIF